MSFGEDNLRKCVVRGSTGGIARLQVGSRGFAVDSHFVDVNVILEQRPQGMYPLERNDEDSEILLKRI